MPTEISPLSHEAKKALSPSLLHLIERAYAKRVTIVTEKSPQAEGEVAIKIVDTKDTPIEN